MIYEWLSNYSGALRALSNTGYFLLWGVFLQLMYLMFRRKRLTRLLINRGKSKDMEALCIISNMSAEPIFVEYIIAELETSQGSIVLDVTDQDREYSEEEEDSESEQNNARYGPLESSGFLHIGSFAKLVERLAQAGEIDMQAGRPRGDVKLQGLILRVIGVHGPEDNPVGAERRFAFVDTPSGYTLAPQLGDTKQLASRKQRRQLKRIAEFYSARN